MKKHMLKIVVAFSMIILMGCNKASQNELSLVSPDKNIKVEFNLSGEGEPFYQVWFNNKTVIDTSFLGFNLENAKSLKDNFKILNSSLNPFNETWQMPWGEQVNVVNNYNALKVELQEKMEPFRKLNIVFKVYNDGIGFRYEFPKQDNFSEALITEENTQFKLTEDYKTFWQAGDWDSYEHLYKTTKLSEINAFKERNKKLAKSYIPNNAVNTPVTMVGTNGVHLSFHEAALVDYSGMTLGINAKDLMLESVLVGSDNHKYKAKRDLPFNTPWRTIQIANTAPELITSKLILNLNEPNKIGDVSWFKPTKYTGIWWEMHVGKSTWDRASGRHGATTANTKHYIDFASKNNLKGVLVEGWNTGWRKEEGGFDFVTPYPDYDLKEVVRYGKEKGVDIIMHHETNSDVERYIQQQDTAFALMQSLGLHTVKTGYVGKIKPNGEYHHGQYMVNHYNNTVIKANKYQVAINAHEPIKDTGLRRTYPNTISREGLRGQEFNASWAVDGGNPPEHLPIVAFTRMLAGPIDFTPGIFHITEINGKSNYLNTTLGQQLALYVVIYSPIQMAGDLIENYEANPEPFQFIKDVGVDWQETKVLNGEVGDFVTIARKEKFTGNWFVGSITDENPRDIEINFNFLDDDQSYNAIIYKDGKDANWKDNQFAIAIEKLIITKGTKLAVHLAPGGGFAMSLKK
tara:strand:- start:27188 stop:29248 length:2061 start_codon:yes stop_codon:yes gene_type:complete